MKIVKIVKIVKKSDGVKEEQAAYTKKQVDKHIGSVKSAMASISPKIKVSVGHYTDDSHVWAIGCEVPDEDFFLVLAPPQDEDDEWWMFFEDRNGSGRSEQFNSWANAFSTIKNIIDNLF